MTQDHLDGARIPDHRLSVAPSSALDAADLQFSGYLLSGSYGSLGRTGYSYGLNTSHVDVQGDGSSRRLLETLGMAGMHSFGSQLASSRSNSVMSPTSGKHVSTPGVSGSLSTTPFATTPHQSFSSTSNIMPLTGHSSYASLLNKANLLFENNLDSMMLNWTLEESECCRRLVQFWRRHENNNIFCTFKAIPAADRVPNSIVVSCIYWEEKNDFFITSVDCIHLLESLIAVRFTVEEKNRIRRNLEGFRPQTVSKCKSDSAEFFKLIMSFPTPKPRNIEKDVKVFPWRILPLALKKIIGKYTASYSSTASVTLDTYPTSQATSYLQVAGLPLSTSNGGMATFAPFASASNSVLGASSASAAVVAAAAAVTAAAATTHPVTTPGRKGVDDGADIAEKPHSSAAPSSVSGGSYLMNTESSSDEGIGLPLGMGLINGCRLDSAQLKLQPTEMPSISIPASDSVDIDYNNSLLAYGDMQRKTSRSATASYLPGANADTGNGGGVNKNRQDDYRTPCQQAMPSFMVPQGCTSRLDFAGMASDNPIPFLSANTSTQQAPPAQALISSSILDQLAASYAFSPSTYAMQMVEGQEDTHNISQQQQLAGQQRQQKQQKHRAVRSSSTKRNKQNTPYSTERNDHRRNNAASRSISTSNSPENCVGHRETSPSIPLILEQQHMQQDVSTFNFNSLINIETASASSSSSLTFGESAGINVDGVSGYADSDSYGFDDIANVSFYDMLKRASSDSARNNNRGNVGTLSGKSPQCTAAALAAGDTDIASILTPNGAQGTGTESDMFRFSLGGSDFSLLADLIGAGAAASSKAQNVVISGIGDEDGLSPRSNNTLALEAMSGESYTADMFSLASLPGQQHILNKTGDASKMGLQQQDQQQQPFLGVEMFGEARIP
ncbi:hypothetical protein GGI25_002631 [Coemansia spiralis]|uniref:DUF7082 domain-containing protein n=2 Tax=Coemansia TaxID=4863 RepID=A0A9W8KYW5_9FUNG|nr:hypothetical protein GGI26_004840 [Coemansia sp. RSA 1358]KAJ2678127.1 hypothetical protein GGI25_002631 [Coemansia spiralis]